MIAEELKDYPQIDFRWKEVGLSFQIQFVKLDFVEGQDLRQELGVELRVELGQEFKKPTLYSNILEYLQAREMTKQELANALLLGKISGYLHRTISKLINQKLIDRTIPDNPTHPAQKFKLTERGRIFLELLDTLRRNN